MSTATEWLRDNEKYLKDIAAAMDDSDPYLAGELLELIAPQPSGENVRVHEKSLASLSSRVVEVVDPKTGQLDNPGGPALVKSNGTRKWYTAGMLHNQSGPAVIRMNGEVEYYYLGTRCHDAAELDALVEKAKTHAAKTQNLKAPQTRSISA